MFTHQKPLYTISETLELLSHSRGKFYEEVRLGSVRIIKRGRRSFVSAEEIDRYIKAKSAQRIESVESGHSRKYIAVEDDA